MHTSHVSALSWTILTLQASESLKKSLRDFGSHPLRIPRVVLFGVIIFDWVLYQRVKEELSQGVGHIQEGTALCSKAPVGRNSGKKPASESRPGLLVAKATILRERDGRRLAKPSLGPQEPEGRPAAVARSAVD